MSNQVSSGTSHRPPEPHRPGVHRVAIARWAAAMTALVVGAALGLAMATEPAGAAEPIDLRVSPDSPGLVFNGVGSLSAGASSRLLVDYPRRERDEVLDYLFTPGYGAAQHILKVEIGGDTNSTDGTEPSHLHQRGEVDCDRGYEWWLMKEAKKRNPAIVFDALAWGAPGWIGDGDFWSADMVDYLVSWLDCARGHGLRIDYLGGWNERGFDAGWFVDLKAALLANGYDHVKVVADDSWSWIVAEELAKNPEFAAAVDVIGNHYICGYLGEYQSCPSTDTARSLGKPLSASEQGSQHYDTGATAWARSVNRAYVDGRITSSINWSTVWSAYAGLPFEGAGLMLANEPWSGAYEVGKSIWVTGHITQFTRRGWHYVDDASRRIPGGSVVTLRDPADGGWSSIVETADADSEQTLSYELADGMDTGDVHVWESDLDSSDSEDWFVKTADIRPSNGRFTFTAKPGRLYSITTTAGQGKGTATSPQSLAWRLPYTDDFDDDATGSTPRYLSDLGSVFEVAPCTGRDGGCLRSVVDHQPIQWNNVANYPLTVIGDQQNWRNYRVQIDALLEQPGGIELAGRSTNGTGGYRLQVEDDGSWKLWRGSDNRTLASGAAAFGVGTWHTLALDFDGDRIRAFLDDELLADLRDSRHAHGQVDIAGRPWTTFQVDDFSVTPHQQPGVPTVDVTSPDRPRVERAGDSFVVSTDIRNPGPSASQVTPRIELPAGWTAEPSGETSTRLQPGDSVTARWTVTTAADAEPGGYAGSVDVDYRSDGDAGTVSAPLDIRLGAVPPDEMTASATSAQGDSYAAAKAIDDDPVTMWHTQWDPRDHLPQALTLDLGHARATTGVTYLPRQDGNTNGIITRYTIELSADGEAWTTAASGSWVLDSSAKKVGWAQTTARFVRLTAEEAGGGYGSAAEVEVYANAEPAPGP